MGLDEHTGAEITRLLHAWRDGQKEAFDQLIQLVYDHLHTAAHHALQQEFRGSGLQTTELLHEAYVQLLGKREVNWENRKHFFHTAGLAMHRFLIDQARKRNAKIKGGDIVHTPFTDEADPMNVDHETLLLVNEALALIEEDDPQLADIIKLRYFAGYTIKETAEILDMPVIQVNRRWTFAKAWLKDHINKKK